MPRKKTQALRILKRVNKDRRPILITLHGKPAGVLVSPEDFDRLSESARFMDGVRKGLSDSEHGRLIDDVYLDADIEKALSGGEKK